MGCSVSRRRTRGWAAFGGKKFGGAPFINDWRKVDFPARNVKLPARSIFAARVLPRCHPNLTPDRRAIFLRPIASPQPSGIGSARRETMRMRATRAGADVRTPRNNDG